MHRHTLLVQVMQESSLNNLSSFRTSGNHPHSRVCVCVRATSCCYTAAV